MEDIKPNRAVRRFDVFAEYQRNKALKDQMAEDEAKGYGIWLAKLVAARRFSKGKKEAPEKGKERGKEEKEDKREELVEGKWRSLDGVAQTDQMFEEEIIQRMGGEFYQKVFSPAIRQAYESGKDYTEIRDTIRKDWKPPAGR
jgi:hypothetical protein